MGKIYAFFKGCKTATENTTKETPFRSMGHMTGCKKETPEWLNCSGIKI